MFIRKSRTAERSVDIDLIEPIQETTIESKKQKKGGKNNFLGEQILHGQFLQQTKEVGNQDG